MKKSTSIRTKHAPHFYIIFAAAAVLIGIFGTIVYTNVFAQTTEVIYACVQKVSGNMRIVSATDSCKSNETALNWNKQGPTGPQGAPGASANSNLPYTCNTCVLYPSADKFKGKDFTQAQLNKVDFHGVDLSGTIFKGSLMGNVDFSDGNLTGADFSNAGNYSGKLNSIEYALAVDFTNANLTNVDFSNSYNESKFINANLQNANFTNATLIFANFSGAQNMNTANITGVTWKNVTCPDGTNSNNNGNTCVGHL